MAKPPSPVLTGLYALGTAKPGGRYTTVDVSDHEWDTFVKLTGIDPADVSIETVLHTLYGTTTPKDRY